MLVPLRAFLGFTFCFAGLQKLANPNFFRAASPISIRAQLVAAERISPLHHLLGHLLKISTLVGLLIALGELAVGLGVLTGVRTRVAAAGGMLIAFSLFLTVSYHSHPWYTGADIGYFFAFTPLLLAGPGDLTVGVLADRWLNMPPPPGSPRRARPEVDQGRRDVLVTGGLALTGAVLAGLVAGLGRLAGGTKSPKAPAQLSTSKPKPKPAATTTTTAPAGTGTTSPPTTTTGGATPTGTKLGPASDVPVGGWASFTDPASGDPALVIRPNASRFVAFDAVCPHAGCTVSYEQSQNVIVCPCHGSLFNANTGAVEQGPATAGLRPIGITDGPDGNLYAV